MAASCPAVFPKVGEIVWLNTIWMFDLLGAEKIASWVWINMFAMMNTLFRKILYTIFLSTAYRIIRETVRKPQWSQLKSHPPLPSHPTLVLPCQGGNFIDLTWYSLCKSLLAVSYHLVVTMVPIDCSIIPSRVSLSIKMRLTGLMGLGPPFFMYSPFSASVLWHLSCLPHVLRGSCKWFTDYFCELLQNPLVNSIIPYEVEYFALL